MENNIGISNNETVSGNVKISLISKGGDKVINSYNCHNTGTINVCKYLRDALSGKHVINMRPGIIIPCRGTGSDDDTNLEDINNGYPYQGNISLPEPSKDSDVCSMKLTFLISSELSGEPIAGFKLCSLDSQGSSNKTVYAWINVINQIGQPIEITSGVNLKVEWIINITYK